MQIKLNEITLADQCIKIVYHTSLKYVSSFQNFTSQGDFMYSVSLAHWINHCSEAFVSPFIEI